jgi:hypothetical protein
VNVNPILRGLCCALATLSAFAVSAIAQPSGQLLYELNFERSVVSNGGLKEANGRKTYALKHEGSGREPEVVFDPVLKSKVLDFKVDATPKGTKKDRSELTIYSGVELGKTYWVAMKVMVPNGNAVAQNWHSFIQCAQAGASGDSPAFSLSLGAPSKMMVISRSDEDRYKEVGKTELPVGKWVQLELELKMGEQGRASVFLDGKPAISGEAPLRHKRGAPRCTLKVGIYRGEAATPYEIRVDDIRLGTSREAVAGRR